MTHPNYVVTLRRGAFAGVVDPFAEDDHTFAQIHGMMIGEMIRQLSEPLTALGYYISREPSLQIADLRKPDVVVETSQPLKRAGMTYGSLLREMEMPSVMLVELDETTLDAILIRQLDTHQVVTVMELVSPGNKISTPRIERYQEQRRELFLAQGIRVVEIDLTRSLRRLYEHPMTASAPYHTVVMIPDEGDYVGQQAFLEPLQPVLVPLVGTGIRLDLQAAYTTSYEQVTIPIQLRQRGDYHAKALPFAQTLTSEQVRRVMERVESWEAALARLVEK
jgi:hypothetical protein